MGKRLIKVADKERQEKEAEERQIRIQTKIIQDRIKKTSLSKLIEKVQKNFKPKKVVKKNGVFLCSRKNVGNRVFSRLPLSEANKFFII